MTSRTHSKTTHSGLRRSLLALGILIWLSSTPSFMRTPAPIAPTTASAAVYEPGYRIPDRSIKLLDPQAQAATPPRTAYLNGSDVQFQVAHSPRSVEEVVALYRHHYTVEPTTTSALAAIGDSSLPSWLGPEGQKLLSHLAVIESQRYVILGDSDGVYFAGALLAPHGSTFSESIPALRQLMVDGTLDVLHEPVMAAILPEPAGGTTIIHAVPQPGFRIRSLLPGPTQDAEGSDPTWLKRPQGSVRLFSLVESDDVGDYAVHSYGSDAQLDALVGQLEAQGVRGHWSESSRRRIWTGHKTLDDQRIATLSVSPGGHAFRAMLTAITSSG